MPTEPDNNIDEQLKSWAKKRRDDASGSFELHPVSRKLLQDEVARTFSSGEQDVERPVSWLTLLRPKLAFAFSVIAVMTILGVMFWPATSRIKSESETTVALAERKLSADSTVTKRSDADLRQQIATSRLADGGNSDSARNPQEPAPTPAVREPAQIAVPQSSPARTDTLPELAKLDDARSKSLKLQSESTDRSYGEESRKLTLARKAKDATPKDESLIVTRETQAGKEIQEQPAEEFALSKAAAPPAAAPAPAATTAAGGGSLNRPGVVAGPEARQTPSGRSVSATLDSKVDAQAVVIVDSGVAGLQYGLRDRRAESGAPVALEMDRLQSANARAFFNQTTNPATQRFAQYAKYRRNWNSPPAPNVLTSFLLERNGSQLRIVDADGSVYEGGFETSPGGAGEKEVLGRSAQNQNEKKNALDRPASAQSEAIPTYAFAAAPNSQASAFRVSGTNLTLKQVVVFTGTFVDPTNLPVAGLGGAYLYQPDRGALPSGLANQTNTLQNQTVPSAAWVQGEATFGANRVQISASPVGP